MLGRVLVTLLGCALVAAPVAAEPDEAPQSEPVEEPWCYQGEGIEALSGGMCHFTPTRKDGSLPETLVIFLHGLTKVGTTWQWSGQRAMVRAAKVHGFSVLTPRGRVGAGSARFADHYNWPTSAAGQKALEAEVLAEWAEARELLEARNGRPFSRVYVWGFSAGAYYGASLALRGRLPIQGYAVFAGGGAPKGVERWAKGTQPKVPVYVGYGRKDRAWRDPAALGRALTTMRWPSKVVARAKVGHSMTDAQVKEAFTFLEPKKPRATGGRRHESTRN